MLIEEMAILEEKEEIKTQITEEILWMMDQAESRVKFEKNLKLMLDQEV